MSGNVADPTTANTHQLQEQVLRNTESITLQKPLASMINFSRDDLTPNYIKEDDNGERAADAIDAHIRIGLKENATCHIEEFDCENAQYSASNHCIYHELEIYHFASSYGVVWISRFYFVLSQIRSHLLDWIHFT